MWKMRFVMRHILRGKAKTVLTELTTFVFVFFLGILQMSMVNIEDEIDWLYLNTFVNAEVRYNPQDDITGAINRIIGDVVPRSLVEDMFAGDFINTYYLETSHPFAFIVPRGQSANDIATYMLPEFFEGDASDSTEFPLRSFMGRFDRLFATDNLRHFTESPEGFVGRPVFGIFAGGGNMAITSVTKCRLCI